MWAVMTAGAVSASARNGISSRASNSASDLSTLGRAWWESVWVSPWPGKCLTQQATPSLAEPAIQASASSDARHGSAPNERSQRLDMRLTKAEKAKLTAKAKATRRTVTSIVLEAIEKIK